MAGGSICPTDQGPARASASPACTNPHRQHLRAMGTGARAMSRTQQRGLPSHKRGVARVVGPSTSASTGTSGALRGGGGSCWQRGVWQGARPCAARGGACAQRRAAREVDAPHSSAAHCVRNCASSESRRACSRPGEVVPGVGGEWVARAQGRLPCCAATYTCTRGSCACAAASGIQAVDLGKVSGGRG